MKPSVQFLLESYCGEKLTDDSESLERSSESEGAIQWRLSETREDDNLFPFLQTAEAGIQNGNLNVRQRRNIRDVALKLKNVADSVCIGPKSAILSIERAVLKKEGLSEEEMQVVQNILSEKTPTTVSKVADHLSKLISSHTVHATLRYLCYNAKSVPEELAIACELIKLTFPKIRQLSRADSVFEVVNDFMQDRLDYMLRQT